MVFVRARGSFVDGFEWVVAPFSWTTFTAHRSFLVRAVLGKWVKPILNIAEFSGDFFFFFVGGGGSGAVWLGKHILTWLDFHLNGSRKAKVSVSRKFTSVEKDKT